MGKALVVYYSVGGNTALVAEAIAAELGADLVRIQDNVKRTGLIGFMRTGFQAFKKKTVPINPVDADVAAYDLVLFGSPTYAGGIAPGLRRFIEESRDRLVRAAYFGTGGDPKRESVLDSLEEAVGIPRVAGLYVCDRTLKAGQAGEMVAAFCNSLR